MVGSISQNAARAGRKAVQQFEYQGQPARDLIEDISDRIEKIRSLAANSDIGGEAEGHQIGHECKQILSSISALG